MNTYLSFEIFNQHYAVDALMILEVIQKQDIIMVPNAPPHVLGVISFRGEVVPIYETRDKLNLPSRPVFDPYVIIIIDVPQKDGRTRIGAIVDKVFDVLEINSEDIKPTPPLNNNINPDLIKGFVKHDNVFILLLDLEKIF